MAVDAQGDVFIGDTNNNRVVEVPAGGGAQTTVGTGLNFPHGVAVYAPPPTFSADTPGSNAAVGTPYTYTYTATAPAGEPAPTFALSAGNLPPGLSLDPATGVISGTPTTPGTYTFTVATENAANGTLAPPATITVAGPGTVFIADTNNSRVVEVPPGGGTQTTVGTGLNNPIGVAVDAAGDVFIADTNNNRVVEVHAGGGTQTTVDTGLNHPRGVAVDAAGDVFIADSSNNRVVEVPAGGGAQTTVGTGLNFPTGVAVDARGDVFIADINNNRVVEVPAGGGAQTTVGTGLSLPFGVAVDAAGDVFIADDFTSNRVVEVPADGGAQTTVGTGLNNPEGVAVDARGDVFIGDTGNNRVVEVPAGGGAQTTVGTGLNSPTGVAAYAPPPAFIADTPPATATVGAPYSYTYTAATPTGEPAATFAVSGGTLPPGLTLNPTTGVISGIPTTAGTYTFTAETENAANGTLGPSTTITVAKAAQTINFTSNPPTDATVGGPSYTVTATGGPSGNPVVFTSGSSAVCSVSGSTVSFLGAGSCVIDANQAGDTNYTAAPQAQQSVAVAKAAPQTISFPTPTGVTVGQADSALGATASSGLAVSYMSSTPAVCTITSAGKLHAVTAGTCTVTASQAGDSNYLAATPVTDTFSIAAAATSTTLTSSANPAVSGQTVTYTATVSPVADGGTVTFFDGTTPITSCGTPTVDIAGHATCQVTYANTSGSPHSITAAYSGDSNFAASTSAALVETVNPAAQTISFPAPTGVTVGQADSALGATASSGLAVSYTSSTPAVCTITSAGKLHAVTAGTCTVTASQAGNSNYLAATPVTDTFPIAAAATSTALSASPASSSFGQPVTFTAQVSSASAGCLAGTVTFSVDGAPVGMVAANAQGAASLSTSALPAGAHAVTAAFQPSDTTDCMPSSRSITYVVGTTTTLSCPGGSVNGSVFVTGPTLISNCNVRGQVIVQPGGSVDIENSTIGGSILATNRPGAIRVCSSTVNGQVQVTGASGLVIVGDPAANVGCGPNTINGSLVLRNNNHGVEAIGNRVSGQVIAVGNSGPGPFPGDPTTISGNGPR
ncbi:MAG: Ig-like domain repeat protein [Acidimicrobiales bacterium]